MTIQSPLRTSFLLVLIVLLSASAAPAQKPVVLPELTSKRLLNDLQVIVASTPYLGENMTIGLVVPHGSAFDPADKGGLIYLLSRMFMKATLDRSAKDIQEELNYLGATLEVHSDWDGIRFILNGQSSKFERSLLLLYQVVGEAQFNDDDFAKAKQEILEEIEKPEDPRQKVKTQFEVALFRGTTYGRPWRGSQASVKNVTAGDVRLSYRRYLHPGSSSLVVVGSTPASLVLQKAARIWGVWVRGDDVPFTFLPPRKPASRNIYFEDDPGSPAAQFILGNLWPRREEPSYYAGIIAARILQERLNKALPTSLLTAQAEGRRMQSPFYIQGQAAADQAIGQIQKILDMVEAARDLAATPEELAEVQRGWIEEFNSAMNSTAAICNLMLDSELYRLGTNYAAMFPDLVRRNGPDAVKEAAKEWFFPGGVVIVVRGPGAMLKAGLESLGTVLPVTP